MTDEALLDIAEHLTRGAVVALYGESGEYTRAPVDSWRLVPHPNGVRFDGTHTFVISGPWLVDGWFLLSSEGVRLDSIALTGQRQFVPGDRVTVAPSVVVMR